MVLTLSIVTLFSCGPSAREEAATAYVKQMESLFAENKAITREFINVALGLKKKDLETHEVAIRFTDRVVPRAAELAKKVDDIQPGTEALRSTRRLSVRGRFGQRPMPRRPRHGMTVSCSPSRGPNTTTSR